MNVNDKNFQNAFNLAHRANQDGKMNPEARAIFRAIRHQLWLACGAESDAAAVYPPRESPEEN